MAIQPNKVPLLSPVLKTFFAVLLICSLLSCSDAESCNCSSRSDQQRWGDHTMSSTFEQIDGDLFLMNQGTYLPGNLGSYMKNSSSAFNFSDTGLFIIPNGVILWENTRDLVSLYEASFSVVITLSAYRTQVNNSSLVIAILPSLPYGENGSMSMPLNDSLGNSISTSKSIAGSHVSVQIGSTESNRMGQTIESRFVWVEISIEQENNSAADNYTVWIDYNRIGHHISVYVDAEAVKSKPTSLVADIPLVMRATMGQVGFFGLSSSMGQLLQLNTWSSTVEQLQLELQQPFTDCTGSIAQSRPPQTIILGLVVSAAVTAFAFVVSTIVYFYLNSKYRRWRMDLDMLTESMQHLPGMPVQVRFNDIKNATNNFHETTVLGRGAYGVVYRCSLPTQESGHDRIDAAVEVFTRDDNRRYEDFQAEVSVISRLRHKNIVSLIGWSYNRGQTILIYEYMPNGSLDQHLFHKRSDGQQEPTPICEWHTLYNITKDVATGLRYIHHEHEPLVLHRDIKASNILIDSKFHGRLGDFGIACVVDNGKNSYTETGTHGTIGYMPPEYVHSGKATTDTDIFAFGVLMLQIVTGKPPFSSLKVHITDWVWKFHREGKLLDTVDPVLLSTRQFDAGDAIRLLLLGLACTNPNRSDRPDMVKALQVIDKLVAPPAVPLEKPSFAWPPPEGSSSLCSDFITSKSNFDQSSATTVEMVKTGHAPTLDQYRTSHDHPSGGCTQECISLYHTANAV